MEIPTYKLRRWLLVRLEKNEIENTESLHINTCLENGQPYNYLKTMKINGEETNSIQLTPEYNSEEIEIEMTFMGHNDENILTIDLPL